MNPLDSGRRRASSVRMEQKRAIDGFGATALTAFSAVLAFNLVVVKVTNTGMDPVFQAGLRSVLAAPILSLVVALGFFGALAFIISGRFDPTSDTAKLQIVNIVIGALTAGFATVLNFWLGSSQGSKNKDLANFSLQHIQALQAGRAQAAARVGADTEAPSPAAPKAPSS